MSVLTLDDTTFDAALKADKPVIVDFSATWCGPCKMFAPIFHESAEENPEITFANIDVDAAPATAQKFNVQVVPTIISFKEGKEFKRVEGVLQKDRIKSLV
jgi:thioredoxin